ncbi:hypothetical protein ACOSP7_020319 [Xanthoceras sorbifolium]
MRFLANERKVLTKGFWCQCSDAKRGTDVSTVHVLRSCTIRPILSMLPWLNLISLHIIYIYIYMHKPQDHIIFDFDACVPETYI